MIDSAIWPPSNLRRDGGMISQWEQEWTYNHRGSAEPYQLIRVLCWCYASWLDQRWTRFRWSEIWSTMVKRALSARFVFVEFHLVVAENGFWLFNAGKSVTLIWISGHTGIWSNERICPTVGNQHYNKSLARKDTVEWMNEWIRVFI